LPASIVAVVLLGAAVIVHQQGGPHWLWPILGLAGLMCLAGALRSWCYLSRIEVVSGELRIAEGWWRLRQHVLPVAELQKVEQSTSLSSNNVAWYNLWAQPSSGPRIPLARGLTQPAAGTLARLIEEAARGGGLT
jgi:hypothetical protein